MQLNSEFPQIGNYKCSEFIEINNSHYRIKAIKGESDQELLITLGVAPAYKNELKDIVTNSFQSTVTKYREISHPNLSPIVDAGFFEGMPYSVTPFFGNKTLKLWLDKSQDWRDAFRILIPVADVLSVLHAKNLLHRSLNADNIYIDPIMGLKVSNYSLINSSSQERMSYSLTGADEVNPFYTAPEVWQGGGDHLSDQYSFGVVLYELLTGNLPYTSDNPVSLLVLQASKPETSPGYYISGLPKIIDAFILKLLSPDPTSRFGNMDQVKYAMHEMVISPKLQSTTRQVVRPAAKPPQDNNSYSPTTIEDFKSIHQNVEGELAKDLKKAEKEIKKRSKNDVSGCGAVLLIVIILLLIVAIVFFVGLLSNAGVFVELADKLEAWILDNPYLKQLISLFLSNNQ